MDDGLSYLDITKANEHISKGDMLYVVSDMVDLMLALKRRRERFDADAFITSITEAVGEDGTVLFPTFNWDFCRGKTFSVRDTPSKTGALTNAALKRPDFVRTQHPLYSFAVWGRYQKELAAIDCKASFGDGSVFDIMHKRSAKAYVIGIPLLKGLSSVHHVEQNVGVPFRYEKEFTGKYIDADGVESVRTYSMYVRDLDIDPEEIDHFKPMSDIAEKLNVSKTTYWNGVQLHVADLNDVYTLVELDIRCNRARNLYKFKRPDLMRRS